MASLMENRRLKGRMGFGGIFCLFLLVFFFAGTVAAETGNPADPASPAGTAASSASETPGEPETLFGRLESVKAAIQRFIQTMEEIAADPDLDLNQKQARVMELARAYVYGPRNQDYIWLANTQGVLLVHEGMKNLEGSDVTGYRDYDGKLLFVEAIRIGLDRGSGVLTYRPIPSSDQQAFLDATFVRIFEPWGWIVGSAMPKETIEAEIAPPVNEPIPLPPINDQFEASQV
jgi:hypothetical protein